MITRFALLGLAMFVGVVSGQHPSGPEFNLFCRILAEANNMMYGPEYVYDENADRAIVKEMEVLFNATTDDMKDFGNSLWDTKEFLKEHPPPTDPKNRRDAHREIEQLIKDGEEKIRENKKIAEKVNEEVNKAKLSVARGLYGEHVKEVPKDENNITEVLSNTSSIFGHNTSAKESCGHNGGKGAGKTLINDLFCVCTGDPTDAHGPCHPKIWPPKSWGKNECCNTGHNNCKCKWTQIKFGPGKHPHIKPQLISSFNESFEKIEQVCREEMIQGNVKPEKMDALLREYVNMIEMGSAKTQRATKKIFGHSARSKNKKEVTICDGGDGSSQNDDPEKNNEKICVDYSKTLEGEKDIPWHTKFKNYTTLMKNAKQLEEKILKNRAALLLLKSKAWVAYNRESDDETSNLDDMNVSNLFDGAREGITWERRAMAEKKTEERKYIDVSQETTEPSQPSQPVQGQGAPGSPPHYILISSTETSQPSPKKTDEGKGGGEPEVTVISSESTTQETPPSQGPSQAASQPPTQSAKRLRDEKKTEK